MKKLLSLLITIAPVILLAQTNDSNLKTLQIDPKIRNITTPSGITKGNVSDVLQAIVDSKESRIESYSTTGTNSYAITGVSWYAGLAPSLTIHNVKFVNGNTSASTITVNSSSAVPIVKNGATALASGDISAGQVFDLFYDGTNFQLKGGSGGSSLSGTGYAKFSGSTPSYVTAIPNGDLANSSISIAGNSISLGGSITQDQITGLGSIGIVKRTGVNTLGFAVSGTDYAPATSGSSILYANGSGGFSSVTIGSNLSFTTGTLSALTNATTGSFFLRGNGSGGFTNLVSPSDGQLVMKVTGPDFANSGVSSDGTTATFGAVPNFPSQVQNKFFSSPNGSSGVPSFRAIVAADIPTLNQSTTGSAATLTTPRNIWGQSFNGSADISGSLTGVGNVTGGASSMTITAGTGNSRTLTLQSTTSGGTATTFLTGNADQTTTFASSILEGALGYSDTGILGALQSSTNSYNQFIIQNTSNGSAASANFIVNNDQSTASTHYAEFGKNSSGFTGSGSWQIANGSYLDEVTDDLAIGTLANKTLHFFTNSATTDALQIAGSGLITFSSPINGNTFGGSWTASANSQYHLKFNPTITTRGTASDNINGIIIAPTINLQSTTMDAEGLVVDATFSGSGGIVTQAFYSGSTNTLAGMTTGTYTSKSAASTSGSGTGAVFTVIVASATTFTSVTVTTAGSGYQIGDTFTFNGSQFGSGSGSIVYTISAINSQTLGTAASVLRLKHENGIQGLRRYIDFQNSAGTSEGSIEIQKISNGRTNFTINDGSGAMLTSDGINLSTTRSWSSGNYTVAGTFSVSSTSSFTGQITSTYSTPSAVTDFTASAFYHNTTKSLGTMNANINFFSVSANPLLPIGLISATTSLVGGSGYVNGSYTAVPLTGGSGSGAQANITVSGGAVTVVTMSARGTGYQATDVLSASNANLGGSGSGFTVTVSTTDYSGVTSAGIVYAPSQSGASSAYSFYGFYGKPTYNLTTNFTGKVSGVYWDPTITSNTGTSYSFVSTHATSSGGVATSSPTSSWDVNGSLAAGLVTSTGSLSLDITNHTVVITSGTGSYTLPSASGATRRIYVIVNQTGGARTVSSYKDKTGSAQTTVGANAVIWVQSDGSNWYQIN